MRLWRGGRVHAVERIGDAREADSRVLDHLARLGFDPSMPCTVRHFLCFSERPVAERVAALLEAERWRVSVEQEDGDWLVVAARTVALTPLLVEETRTELEALAALHGGHYDGWEADAS